MIVMSSVCRLPCDSAPVQHQGDKAGPEDAGDPAGAEQAGGARPSVAEHGHGLRRRERARGDDGDLPQGGRIAHGSDGGFADPAPSRSLLLHGYSQAVRDSSCGLGGRCAVVSEPRRSGPAVRAACGRRLVDAVHDGAGSRRNERERAGGNEVHDARHVSFHHLHRSEDAERWGEGEK